MKPGRLSVGRIFDSAWGTYKRQGGLVTASTLLYGLCVFLLGLVVAAPIFYLALSGGGGGLVTLNSPAFVAYQLGAQLLIWPLGVFLGLGFFKIFLKVDRGEKAGMGDLFSMRHLWFLGILTNGLFLACQGLALTAFVLPMFWFVVVFGFCIAFMIDRELDPYAALLASEQATRGQRGQLVLIGILSIGLILLGYIACGVGLLITIPLASLVYARTYTTLSDGLQPCECGQRYPRGARRCSVCGLRPGQTAEVEDGVPCRHCGSRISEGADPCPLCGEPEPLGKASAEATAAEAETPTAEAEAPASEASEAETKVPESTEASDAKAPWKVSLPARPPWVGWTLLAVLLLIPPVLFGGSPLNAGQQGALWVPLWIGVPAWLGVVMGLASVCVPSIGVILTLRHRYLSTRAVELFDGGAVFGRTERWAGIRYGWKEDVEGFRITGDGIQLRLKGSFWKRLVRPTIHAEDRQVHEIVVALEERGIFNLAG